MNSNLLKSVAHEAKDRLREHGFDVCSTHIHETIAALHGHNSNAAFRAVALPPLNAVAGMPVVVHLDTLCASNRVKTLLPGIGGRKAPLSDDAKGQADAAYVIARTVSESLEATSTREIIFLGPIWHSVENSALKAYAKSVAMADPVMFGVKDDPEARYQEAIDQGTSEDMARLEAKFLGPLSFPFGTCHAADDWIQIELSDQYSSPDGNGGVVRVYCEGTMCGRRTFLIDSVRVEFSEGEYFDDIPEYSGSFGEV